MNTFLPIAMSQGYKSGSQQIRKMTEKWVKDEIFCPNCGRELFLFENNKPVADYFCRNCGEEFELKSKKGSLGRKVVDGAYSTMIERLTAANNPNLFFLTYDADSLYVKNLFAIPKYFFVPEIIEKRNPLGNSAKRAGWVGCNIIVDSLPEFGKIYFLKEGLAQSKEQVMSDWKKTIFLQNSRDLKNKGWLFDVMKCIEKLSKVDFLIDDIYKFEGYLQAKHPDNHNIKAKIRQQLQFLRDKNVIEFFGDGRYRLTS